MSPTLRFVSGDYDEQTSCMIRDALGLKGLGDYIVTLGRVESVGSQTPNSHSAIKIERKDGNNKSCPGNSTIHAILSAISLIPLSATLVVSGSPKLGGLEYRWTSDLTEFEPAVDEAEDPFGDPPKREVSPEVLAQMRRASGDGDLIPDDKKSS